MGAVLLEHEHGTSTSFLVVVNAVGGPRVFSLSAVWRDRGAAVAGRCAIGCTPFTASPRRRTGLPTRPRSDVPVGSGQPVGNAFPRKDPQQWPQWTDTVRPAGGRSAMIRTRRHASALVSTHRHGPPSEQHVDTGSTFGALKQRRDLPCIAPPPPIYRITCRSRASAGGGNDRQATGHVPDNGPLSQPRRARRTCTRRVLTAPSRLPAAGLVDLRQDREPCRGIGGR
jgi:hypothetical protein